MVKKQDGNEVTVAEVPGYRTAGVSCDIRGRGDGRLDLAVVEAEAGSAWAGVFTRNRLAAAPVERGRRQLAAGGKIRAVVINSGNANACTGEAGERDAEAMATMTAEAMGCAAEEVVVCSTGRIGEPLPMGRIGEGIVAAVRALGKGREPGWRAAQAILTSDTREKLAAERVTVGGREIRIAGMAKGAGMIEPNMATMLAYVVTDAAIGGEDLQMLLQESVRGSFNAITVDGDESTNDTVLLLANGASGVKLAPGGEGWAEFAAAVGRVCGRLARQIVGDGEKISKVVEVQIGGAATEAEAEQAARAIGNSLLVKASWYGNDPNWGRVLDALGYSGAAVEQGSVRMRYAEAGGEAVEVFSRGRVATENRERWREVVAQPEFRIELDLGQGAAEYRLWSTDLTEGYVDFNKSE